jgi:zinc transporter ZupT
MVRSSLPVFLFGSLLANVEAAGTHPWEYAATFKLTAHAPFSWIWQRKAGMWADADMKFAWYAAATDTAAAIESQEAAAKTLFATTPVAVTQGKTLSPGVLYKMTMDQGAALTMFKMNPAGTTKHITTFMQHNPSEFENKLHWLQDADGGDLEPTATEPAKKVPVVVVPEDHTSTSYLACVIVLFVSLAGIAFSGKGFLTFVGGTDRFRVASSAFASGALLFAAFGLMFPEAVHKLGTGGFKESTVNAYFATSFIVGILLCIGLDNMGDKLFMKKKQVEAEKPAVPVDGIAAAIEEGGAVATIPAKTNAVAKTDAAPAVPKSFTDTSTWSCIVVQIIVGDFFHNFVDGIVIGTAFKSCSSSAGWTVSAGVVYHELSQEIADFLVLISTGGMSFKQAVVANFMSGTGVILGCIVINSTKPSSPWLGALLTFGGAIYVFIGLAQLQWWTERADDFMRNLVFFVVGCLGIGLVLLSHEHCKPLVAAGTAVVNAHAGHGH